MLNLWSVSFYVYCGSMMDDNELARKVYEQKEKTHSMV